MKPIGIAYILVAVGVAFALINVVKGEWLGAAADFFLALVFALVIIIRNFIRRRNENRWKVSGNFADRE